VRVTQCVRWSLGLGLAAFVMVVPYVYYRWDYTHAKRLRVVEPGRVYRSGQMTVSGFEEAVRQYRIRTIVNLQDEYPDPDVDVGYFARGTEKEAALCRRLGVQYVYLQPDLIPRHEFRAGGRPRAIERFLAIMDDPANYPVLLHCRAGLHRTGCLTAVYRMEYDGWTPREAIREVKRHGFGDGACTSANDYIPQYILTYQRHHRLAAH
jgi:tyrosine-protein phosphatase SIW14